MPHEFADDDLEAIGAELDLLATLVLSRLGPALAWHRGETARRLDLDAPSMACLELLRRRPVTSRVIAERTGLSPAGVSGMLDRLEAAGHVVRDPRTRRGESLEVSLRPHAERDAEWARVHAELAKRFRDTIVHRVRASGWRPSVALVGEIAELVHADARDAADRVADERRVAKIRAARGW